MIVTTTVLDRLLLTLVLSYFSLEYELTEFPEGSCVMQPNIADAVTLFEELGLAEAACDAAGVSAPDPETGD